MCVLMLRAQSSAKRSPCGYLDLCVCFESCDVDHSVICPVSHSELDALVILL